MDRTEHTTTTPSARPAPNRIIDEPATLDRCREDYASGAATREALDRNVHRYSR
jgi:hypothetical protein